MKPPPCTHGWRMRLSDVQAAVLATATLNRRVPAATIRSWKNRDLIAGGHGWTDGEFLGKFLDCLALGNTPMIASQVAKRPDLVQHGNAYSRAQNQVCNHLPALGGETTR